MARGDDITTDYGEGWRAGAEAMRALIANAQMCACDTAEQARVILAPPNSAERWRACHRTDCLALICADILATPIPAPPPQPDGLIYRGG